MKIDRNLIGDFQLHPLGFYYLKLSSGDTTSRLHVYSESSASLESNDWHTHEFDLRSKVLAGSLKNEIGQFVVDGEGPADEYLVEYFGNRSYLRATGQSGKVKGIVSFTTASGCDYYIRAGVIHRALGLVTPCVTHVEMTHTGGPIHSYGRSEIPFVRRKVTPVEASEVLSILEGAKLLLPR
ncbi:hypothetical protein [Solirhodobacter olei]|uniref:hypothetical protein n=1 Tax=Solirhodobacter olei TaxID=2493082 RepID=UPI000FD712CE|nr:hypothetical protein [Solirhodobacter olei]